jgi:hypothetical protein
MNKELFSKISRSILFLLVFFFIFASFTAKIWDPDLWWHLKTGEYIAHTKSIPSTDPFAFTSLPKDPIHPESKRIKFILAQYWVAQLIFYWVYKAFNLQGIIYMRAIILTLLIFLLYRNIRRDGVGFFSALVFLIPADIIFVNFTGERPQLFSFLFTFLLVFLLEGYRKASFSEGNALAPTSHKKAVLTYLLPLPFVMMLWANIHGGFIIGIAVLLGYMCCEILKYLTKKAGPHLQLRPLKYLIGACVVSIMSSLVNPNGYNVIPLLIELNKSQYMTSIIEAKSPLIFIKYGYFTQELYAFFFILAAVFLLFLINFRKADLTDAVIFSGLAALSLSAARVIPFFAPVSILMLARYWKMSVSKWNSSPLMTGIREMTVKLRSLTGSAFSESLLAIVCSVVIIVMLNNGNYFQSGIRKGRYPEGAVKFLKENRIYGNMYNPYVWGGYMLWALYPDYKVFIDGRGLIEEVFFQSDRIMGASSMQFAGVPEWKAMLDAYQINFIVTFSVSDFTGKLVPLIPALNNDPDWNLVYMDNYSLIFVKSGPENQEIIDKFSMPKNWAWNEVLTEASKKSNDFRGNANYYVTMGDALVARENYRDALTAYLKAQNIAPDNIIIREKLNMMRNSGQASEPARP